MHCTTTELTSWAVSKKKWDTKEDKGKSMMCALYTSWDKATSNSEKNQAHSLSRYRITFA